METVYTVLISNFADFPAQSLMKPFLVSSYSTYIYNSRGDWFYSVWLPMANGFFL